MVEIAVATTSFHDLLEAQRNLFESQIEKLEVVVATQCKLTGVNPLSQEMAAGALSIKIGKRPRDLMNLKAVKYMQSVFSIKDAIGKRETREISARFGVTVTQVRDFFTGQRSRVRKFARLSRKKAGRSAAARVALQDEVALPLNPIMPAQPLPLDVMAPVDIEEGPSCSRKHDILTGMTQSDKHFIANIFGLMRKEGSFTGQAKLLNWILQMRNGSVLKWFVTEGGVLILATWISQAAIEEQTSHIQVILEVLSWLPVSEALPGHISALLLSLNRLRFYRRLGISKSARTQLSRWSDILKEMHKSRGVKSLSHAQDEMLLKSSINEVMSDNSWKPNNDTNEALKFLSNNPDNHEKLETSQPLKMLTASSDGSNKRLGVLPLQTRERRKVQMLEHPDQRLAVRSPQFAKSKPAPQCRPLSADDIQKSKMRAQYMQNKKGKKRIACSDNQVKPESPDSCSFTEATVLPSVSTSYVQAELQGGMKLDSAICRVANPQETHQDLEEHPQKKYKRLQIPWRTPQELKIVEAWRVGTGANSKEVEAQRNRIRREREVIYREIQEIPLDPSEPWDRERDYDDTLTPVIPIEQILEPLETPSVSVNPTVPRSSTSMPEPDFELLGALLKNPELVFALTSGKAGDVLSDETVTLLDMIRTNGVSSLGNLRGIPYNHVEVSLPSPMPSSDVPNGSRPDFDRNPFPEQPVMPNGTPYQAPVIVHSVQPQQAAPALTFFHPQNRPTQTPASLPSATFGQSVHMVAPPVASPQTSIQLPEQWWTPTNPPMHHQSTWPNASYIHHVTPEIMVNGNTMGNVRTSPVFIETPVGARQGVESTYYNQQSPLPNNYNAYVQGPVPAVGWDGRSKLMERPNFESRSSDYRKSRQHEYIPSRNYNRPK